MRQASYRSLRGRHSLALGDLEASQRTMSELQRLKGLLPPEMQSWVFVEAAAAVEPPLITLEEIGRDEVEIQVDLDQWDSLALDHRNLLFWHEVGRVQNGCCHRKCRAGCSWRLRLRWNHR